MISAQEFLYAMVNMGEKMTEEEVLEIISEELGEGAKKLEDFAKVMMSRI